MDTNHSQYIFNSNNSSISNSFINILINFDSTDSVENFKAQINKINLNVEIFFDIYGFYGFDLDTDYNIVKTKWDELKNELMANKSNGIFEIFLNLFKQNKNKSKPININIQIKIIDSICKILSNQELKNIYDDYYLDWYINYIKTNKDKIKKALKKIKLIDKVYDNIFIKPTIKNEKADIDRMENEFKFMSQYYDFSKQDNKTPEELEKLYIELNEIKYSYNFDDDKTPEEINKKNLEEIETQQNEMKKHKNQIVYPPINYNYMDFLTELANKHNITNTTNLINYYYWKKYTDCTSNTKLIDEYHNGHNRIYIKKTNNNSLNYIQFNDLGSDDTYIDEFTNKFDIGKFETWCLRNSKSDKKNTNTLNDEYTQLVEIRKAQNKGIEKYFDTDRLNYFANREFTLHQLWNECEYGTTINNDLILPYMDENYIQMNKINND
jgi:hypothetical protein